MTNENTNATDARRFDGAVHDEVNADIGPNRSGERVVRVDLTYTRGTAASTTTLVLTTDAAITLRNLLDSLFDAAGIDDGPSPDAEVAAEDACPNCGERRQDMLVWFDNADQVQCEACGMVYAPPRAAGTAGQPRDEPRGW